MHAAATVISVHGMNACNKEVHMKNRSSIIAAVIVGLFAIPAGADDWPGWRGPQRTGISKETGLLKTWPKDGPRLLWAVTDV
ncbi:MAG: hypothetical protein ABSG43_31190, partial [Solirubrobacteraceae bacterium]